MTLWHFVDDLWHTVNLETSTAQKLDMQCPKTIKSLLKKRDKHCLKSGKQCKKATNCSELRIKIRKEQSAQLRAQETSSASRWQVAVPAHAPKTTWCINLIKSKFRFKKFAPVSGQVSKRVFRKLFRPRSTFLSQSRGSLGQTIFPAKKNQNLSVFASGSFLNAIISQSRSNDSRARSGAVNLARMIKTQKGPGQFGLEAERQRSQGKLDGVQGTVW